MLMLIYLLFVLSGHSLVICIFFEAHCRILSRNVTVSPLETMLITIHDHLSISLRTWGEHTSFIQGSQMTSGETGNFWCPRW